ncbi:MAG: hypothetical protein EHM80_01290 [Nitrospiraceae bacterium]|nr:MAG: hypothetical protein EHM80_01290 [Nitrospiraceae bacterium]
MGQRRKSTAKYKREAVAMLDTPEVTVAPMRSRRGFEPTDRNTPEPTPPRRRHGIDNVDALIAEAKRAVYTSCHGKPDQDRATRKGDTHGSV